MIRKRTSFIFLIVNKLHLDFEVFGEESLKTVGADKYARHPSTEALMLGWKYNENPIQIWDIKSGEKPPRLLMTALYDEETLIYAFNARFEYLILRFVLKIHVPIHRFRCTMVAAYCLSFTRSLNDVLEQIGFAQRKLKEGKSLILRFSKLQPRTHKVKRWDHLNDPEGWAKFKQYCMQDVQVEYDLNNWLSQYHPISDEEQRLWIIDQQINDRGMPVDVSLCSNALKLRSHFKSRIKTELRFLTGLENPLSNSQMRTWLESKGHATSNLKEKTLLRLIEKANGVYDYILRKYYEATRTAGTKWQSFIAHTDSDANVVRGAFQFAGASRTRRWAGRGVQLHNLKRGPLDNQAAEIITAGNPSLLSALYPQPMDTLSSAIRAAITAPEGYSLVVADYTSIESVLLGYLSNCRTITEMFLQGMDTYRVFASQYFHVPYEEVTKEQRTFCKPPVLGCGYGLGAKGLVAYADGMGVKMSEDDASKAVSVFRDSYPEVQKMWYDLLNYIELVLTQPPGVVYKLYRVKIYMEDSNFLFIELPSGRRLAYYQPLWCNWDTPIGRKPSFTYMGLDRYSLKWQRIAAHGGLVVENIDQAVARDVLAHGMIKAHINGLNIVGHVHDELITLSDSEAAEARLKALCTCMTTRPPWAQDLWLGAHGYVAKRYRKD